MGPPTRTSAAWSTNERERFNGKRSPSWFHGIQKLGKHGLDVIFSSKNNQLKTFLGYTKDLIDQMAKLGKYKISCADCSIVYIAKTRRNIETCLGGHLKETKLAKKGCNGLQIEGSGTSGRALVDAIIMHPGKKGKGNLIKLCGVLNASSELSTESACWFRGFSTGLCLSVLTSNTQMSSIRCSFRRLLVS